MRCLGCGSKVPATRLKQVLGERTSALTYDDAHAFSDTAGELWLQTIDQIRPLVPDLYLLGKIGLIHAASDIYAMGGEVVSVLANLSIENLRVASQTICLLSSAREVSIRQALRALLSMEVIVLKALRHK